MSKKQFPVLGDPKIKSVAWDLVEPHREQAALNHGGQSLEVLAARGGLSLDELVAVVADRSWFGLFKVH